MKINLLISSVLVCLFIAFPVTPLNADNALTVHFIDVGQGDSTLVMLPDHENILIDAGSPANGPQLVRYLKTRGIDTIHHFILTHPHDDHMGGVFDLLSEFKVKNFYDNGFSNFSSTMYGDYVRLVRHDLSKYHILQAGTSLDLSGIRIEVLNPLLPPTGNLNNDSIVLRLIYNDVKILFASDIGNVAERRLLTTKSRLTSQILKVGHHGEYSSSTDAFLERVQPETAVISVGLLNKYARPHPKLIDRLAERNIKMYRTDLVGNIVIKTDGTTYSLFAEK